WSCNASPSEPRLQCSHRNAWRPRCATARPKRPPPPPACEDHRKAPSPPPPSRGGNHESELKRFGNPPVDSVRSDTALMAAAGGGVGALSLLPFGRRAGDEGAGGPVGPRRRFTDNVVGRGSSSGAPRHLLPNGRRGGRTPH